MTAEKQSPSAIDFLANIRSAIDVERRLSSAKGGGAPKALKDVMGKVVSDYNRLCTVKKHRIDGVKRCLCYNLFPSINSGPFSCLVFSLQFFTPQVEFRELLKPAESPSPWSIS